MVLRCAEDQRFLRLVDLLHEEFNPLFFSLLDLDDLVEIGLDVTLPGFDLTFHYRVVGRVHVVIKRCGNLLHLEGREKSVIDAVFKRVDIHRLAEILISVNVFVALGRGGKAKLHRWREVIHDCRASCSRRSRRPDGIRR